ncbi:hypothetical protein EsH8_II_001520 [Colletotrichum jinshuiense]
MARNCHSRCPSRGPFILLILMILLQIPSVLSGAIHLKELSPRAAFVSLVAEQQLEQMVASIAQLEQRFNDKYHYDWVFFSHEELSEEFKEVTSNATAATGVDADKALIRTAHHKRRWSAGLFAREKRLQAYDWFWMVEPGTQFTCDITFDVFRLMRDRGIAYGVNEVSFEDDANSKMLWQSTRMFMDKHPELVQPRADITWILGGGGNLRNPSTPTTASADYNDAPDDFDGLSGELQSEECQESRPETEGGVPPSVPPDADPRQCEPNTVADAFTTRLAATYDQCNINTPIEIGSLNHFRGPEHSSYFDYLDNSGDFYFSTVSNVPVHSLSASMFLPRDKFWLLGNIVCEMHGLHNCPPMPRPTSGFEALDSSIFLADIIGSSQFGPSEKGCLVFFHRFWTSMASDIARQNGIPSAQTGHTALDDRNFKIYKPERYPVGVEEGWYSMKDGWRSWLSDRVTWFASLLGW